MDSELDNITATLGSYDKTDDGEENNMISDVLRRITHQKFGKTGLT